MITPARNWQRCRRPIARPARPQALWSTRTPCQTGEGPIVCATNPQAPTRLSLQAQARLRASRKKCSVDSSCSLAISPIGISYLRTAPNGPTHTRGARVRARMRLSRAVANGATAPRQTAPQR